MLPAGMPGTRIVEGRALNGNGISEPMSTSGFQGASLARSSTRRGTPWAECPRRRRPASARGRFGSGPERLADGAEHADRRRPHAGGSARAGRGRRSCRGSRSSLRAAFTRWIDSGRRIGTSRIAGEVHEAAGQRARAHFGRGDAQHELFAGPGLLRDHRAVFEKDAAAMRGCTPWLRPGSSWGRALTTRPRSPPRAPPCARRRRCAPGRGSPDCGPSATSEAISMPRFMRLRMHDDGVGLGFREALARRGRTSAK